jgi:hypothetical protein
MSALCPGLPAGANTSHGRAGADHHARRAAAPHHTFHIAFTGTTLWCTSPYCSSLTSVMCGAVGRAGVLQVVGEFRLEGLVAQALRYQRSQVEGHRATVASLPSTPAGGVMALPTPLSLLENYQPAVSIDAKDPSSEAETEAEPQTELRVLSHPDEVCCCCYCCCCYIQASFVVRAHPHLSSLLCVLTTHFSVCVCLCVSSAGVVCELLSLRSVPR